MFRSVPMVHLRVQAPNRDAPAVTRCIASEGLLHLVDLAHGRPAGDASPPGTRELLAAFRDLARRVARLAERSGVALPDPEGKLPAIETVDFERERASIEETLAPVEAVLDEKWRARAAASERRDRFRETALRVGALRGAGVDFERVDRLRGLAVSFGRIALPDITTLATVLAPSPFAVIPLDAAEPALVAAVVGAADRSRLEEALRLVAFARIPLPASVSEREPESLAREEREAAEEADRLGREIEEHVVRVRPLMSELWQRTQVGALLLGAQSLFAAAGRFVVISGWVPEESAERMRAALAKRVNGRVVVEIERPEELPEVAAGILKVPILHRNPVLLRPFQKLVEIYGTPSYGEVEPTAFFAVSFLLMFGLMFGDVGHGLVLFAAGYCLFRWIPRYLDYGILLMEAGVASAIFGFLYGSFFGIEGALPVLWMEPMRDLPHFLPIAIGLGVLLVSAGLVLNVVNAWRAGERAAAVFGPRGLFGAFGYWVVVAVAARIVLSPDARLPATVVAILLAIPVLLLVFRGPIVARLEKGRAPQRPETPGTPRWLGALEGSVELVDSIVSFFANTISFLRVAAFALVHAGAFVALFALANTIDRTRAGGPIAIAVLIAGNALIVLLEGLTVSVQALRLEYYEFFGKFFRGGGEPYRPLMLRPAAARGDKP